MAENKRRAGRPPKNATPAAKRQRTAVTPQEQTPVVEIVEKEREATPLPNKIAESKPLPTLSRPQPLDLPDDEYQSIGASGVLAASLDRSRQKWVSGDFFQKYWTKTSTRKDAPPPPPNNPQKTWMKEVGVCTMTIEPLILEAHVFHLKEPGMPGPVVQNIAAPRQQQQQQHHQVQYKTPSQQNVQHHPPSQQNIHHQQPAQQNLQSVAPSPYGTPYRPQQAYQTPPQSNQYYHQNRPLPPQSAPSAMQTADNRTLPPIMPAAPAPPLPLAVAPRPPPPAAPAPPPKPSPDPVIQMLATRASSDHELKALMKVVATGSANQEQLRIFQRHIDELTAIINQNKKAQPPPPPPPPQQQQPTPITPMHGAGAYSNVPSRTSTPGISAPQQILPRPGPVNTPPLKPPGQQKHPNQYTAQSQKQAKAQHYPVQPPQKYYPPAQQPSLPVVLEFRGEGASPDRFRFPEYSILEFLSPYMLLVSFLYIRKDESTTSKRGAKEKAQPAGEVIDKKPTEGDNAVQEGGGAAKAEEKMSDGAHIYEPITLKITVDETQKGKDLLGFIQRSVKPVVETRAWMTEQIARCTRAQRRYLALRLPHKSQIREGSEEGKEIKESTPVVAERKKVAPRKSMDKKGKDKEELGEKPEAGAPGQEETASATPALLATPSASDVPLTAEQEVRAIQDAAAAAADTPVPKGRRSTRKSVRISDVQMADV